MDSEQVNFFSSHPTNNETDTQPHETNSQSHEQPSASLETERDTEAQAAQTSKEEAASATRRRRRRPPRGGSRRAQAGTPDTQADEPQAESEAEAGEQEGHSAFPSMIGEEAQEHPSVWVISEPNLSSVDAPPPSPDFFATPLDRSFTDSNFLSAPPQAETAPGASQAVREDRHWWAEPAVGQSGRGSWEWTPPAPGPGETDQTAQVSAQEPGDSAPEMPTAPELAQAAPAEADTEITAAPFASAAEGLTPQTGEETYETVRAPLSGVEVRPPRRYRFDRPAPASREVRHPVAQARPASGRGPAHPGPGVTNPVPTELSASIERSLTETPEIAAEIAAADDLARATKAALIEELGEAQEAEAPASEAAAAPTAEQQNNTGGSRRRRRRRSGPSATPAEGVADKVPAPAPAVAPISAPPPPPMTPPAYPAPIAPVGPLAPASPAAQNYQVANGLQHIGQPQSPFAGPEPSSARGFGPVPRGVAMPVERGVRLPRQDRTIDPSGTTMNQLATLFTQAMQQQTDRLLMELRRNQGTPSMTVNFPPMPSNERIGVFVDVANLLYSARNMRISVDFGRLLDFLRGNRRLVRAHAYCPTSPDPRAEQMFLDAVKGLGYRITTKNYKTFSSGAKKADLDLDLCMDIVRLVDAGSLDCVALVSGDSDFLPLLEYCSDHGVRVEVAAFDEATAGILRQSCDLFINLSMVEEIRA